MKKIIVSILATFLMIFQMQAQQNVMVSQYMFNGLLLNPAYAGSHDYLSSTLMYRNQWVRVDGAPITSILAVDGPLKNRNVGLGLIIMNDKIGATDQTDVYGNYSYSIKIKEGKLALGIKAGVSRYVYNTDKLVYWDKTDNVYEAGNKQTSWLPKFGLGMYYSTKKWYAGLSIPVLFAYDPNYNFSLDVNKSSLDRRHYMATAGVVLPLNEYFKLKPSFLVKYVPNAPIQADLNASLIYKDKFWVGASFRSGDAIATILEYQTGSHFRVGYSYDFTFSNIRKSTYGSHEIMIGYDFGKGVTKTKSPRFF
jgi:type IX secretion system PorP/SprF family membrane protein